MPIPVLGLQGEDLLEIGAGALQVVLATAGRAAAQQRLHADLALQRLVTVRFGLCKLHDLQPHCHHNHQLTASMSLYRLQDLQAQNSLALLKAKTSPLLRLAIGTYSYKVPWSYTLIRIPPASKPWRDWSSTLDCLG